MHLNQNKYFNHRILSINNLYHIHNYNKHKDILINKNLKYLYNKHILLKIQKLSNLK